jgi:hypothetical protein
LVRPDLVVPMGKDVQRAIQLVFVGDAPLIELFFERAKQSFDPAVLPRSVSRSEARLSARTGEPSELCPR